MKNTIHVSTPYRLRSERAGRSTRTPECLLDELRVDVHLRALGHLRAVKVHILQQLLEDRVQAPRASVLHVP